MEWQSQINGDSLAWLLESDPPGVRYLALRDLLNYPSDDPDLAAARKSAHTVGPIATILSKMDESGFWSRPGPGYNPKYSSTVWSLIMLAQLGASIAEDTRLFRACEYLLDHALSKGGQFSHNAVPSGTIDCLQGNLCWALLEMGCLDERLDDAFDWMARSVIGQDVAPAGDRHAPVRYYAYKCGPGFACGANNRLPCGWGAVKVMLTFSRLPVERRTPLIEKAIAQGVVFLFSVDPATAAYPTPNGGPPNRSWWKFGFPVFYITDVLQNVEALAALGFGQDPRLSKALSLIRQKQDAQGRWPLEYNYHGKTWVEFGEARRPNKWVTLRALRVLKMASV